MEVSSTARLRFILATLVILAGVLVLATRTYWGGSPERPQRPRDQPARRTEPEDSAHQSVCAVGIRSVGKPLPKLLMFKSGSQNVQLDVVRSNSPDQGKVFVPSAFVDKRTTIMAPGYVPVEAIIDPTNADSVLVLYALASIVVEGPQPGGAPMHLLLEDGRRAHPIRLEVSGSREVKDLPAGSYAITVSAGEGLALFRRVIELSWGEKKILRVASQPECTAYAGVVKSDSGKAVANATVIAKRLDLLGTPGVGVCHALTNQSGEFRILLPAEHQYRFIAEKQAYARSEPRDVHWSTDEKSSLELYLRKVRSLTVRVLRLDGQAVEGAEVVVREVGRGGSDAQTCRTDGNGASEFATVPDSQEVEIVAEMKGMAPCREFLKAGECEVEIVMFPSDPLVIKVVDAGTGEPVIGAHVQVSLLGLCRSDRSIEIPVGGGYMKVAGLRVEGYSSRFCGRVSVTAEGYQSLNLDVDTRQAELLIVKLKPLGGADLHGIFVDLDGEPYGGAVIRVLRLSGLSGSGRSSAICPTDSEGRFVLRGLDAGEEYSLIAVASNREASSGEIRFRAGEVLKLRVVGHKTGSIVGRIVVTPASLKLVWADMKVVRFEPAVAVAEVESAPKFKGTKPGPFRLDALLPGNYCFRLVSAFCAPLEIDGVVVKPGAVTNLGRLELRAMASLFVLVPASIEAASVRSFAVSSKGDVYPFRRWPGETRWLGHVPSGKYSVFVEDALNGNSLLGSLDVVDGEHHELAYAPKVPSWIELCVVGDTGLPAPGESISIVAQASAPWNRLLVSPLTKRRVSAWPSVPLTQLWPEGNSRSGPAGKLVVGPLQPGNYVVCCGGVEQSVSLESGQRLSMEVQAR